MAANDITIRAKPGVPVEADFQNVVTRDGGFTRLFVVIDTDTGRPYTRLSDGTIQALPIGGGTATGTNTGDKTLDELAGVTSTTFGRALLALADAAAARTALELGTLATLNATSAFIANYVVGDLPAGSLGQIAMVTDQLAAPAAKGVAPEGGGTVKCCVVHNGTGWVGI